MVKQIEIQRICGDPTAARRPRWQDNLDKNFEPAIRHDKANMSSTKRQPLATRPGHGRQRLAGLQGGRDMGPPRQADLIGKKCGWWVVIKHLYHSKILILFFWPLPCVVGGAGEEGRTASELLVNG